MRGVRKRCEGVREGKRCEQCEGIKGQVRGEGFLLLCFSFNYNGGGVPPIMSRKRAVT